MVEKQNGLSCCIHDVVPTAHLVCHSTQCISIYNISCPALLVTVIQCSNRNLHHMNSKMCIIMRVYCSLTIHQQKWTTWTLSLLCYTVMAGCNCNSTLQPNPSASVSYYPLPTSTLKIFRQRTLSFEKQFNGLLRVELLLNLVSNANTLFYKQWSLVLDFLVKGNVFSTFLEVIQVISYLQQIQACRGCLRRKCETG